MATWPTADLRLIARTREVRMATVDESGVATTSTTTWIVAVDGALYARAYRGNESRWYRAALAQSRGRVTAGRSTYDVEFIRMDRSLDTEIDHAYRAKYRFNLHLRRLLTPTMRAATVRIEPL